MRREAELRRVAGPELQVLVGVADPLDGGHVRRLAAGQVEQVGVAAKPPSAVAEGLVLLLPLAVLFALPAAAKTAVLPSGDQPTNCVQEPFSRVSSSARTRRPVPSALTTTARIVADVDVAPAGQVGAELGVADEEVGRRVVPVGREQGGRPQGRRGGPGAEEVAPGDDSGRASRRRIRHVSPLPGRAFVGRSGQRDAAHSKHDKSDAARSASR